MDYTNYTDVLPIFKLNFRMWIKYGLKTQSSQKRHALQS